MEKIIIMKKKILILGSTGMAGHMIYFHLRNLNKYEVINVSYRKKLTEDSLIVDIKDSFKLKELIETVSPDYIINCIGILIKGSTDIENAIYVNAYFPHLLKKMADNVQAKLIHISTDCVFSGKTGKYNENSFRDADDVYGRSKALGEIIDQKHLTIRTSIIGPELKINGEGLFHWFMNQNVEVTGYTNAIWGGVTTLELAKAIVFLLENEYVCGIIHLTNGTEISKYELLILLKTIWKVESVHINKGEGIKAVNKSLIKSAKFNFEVSSYQQMLEDLYEWMNQNKNLYTIYAI
jgi:dTDP-4-dehydrorhamnose reductase